MKPKWEDAPDWAEYLAMDKDGQWVWYEVKPDVVGQMWSIPGPFPKKFWLSFKEEFKTFDQTLEKRP